MHQAQPHIMIVCGEQSGDMRAAALIRAIKTRVPDIRCSGIGGDHCRCEGVELIDNITSLAVIGFTAVIKHYPRIKGVFDRAIAHAEQTRPDAVVLVDYPGFNLRLAKQLKARGFKIIFYVSPQVWAWKASRIQLIKRVVDRMMVFFPFEKDLYAKHDYKADLVGHPLIDDVRAHKDHSAFLKEIGLNDQDKTLALLPGSREKEIAYLLPPMLEAAALIKTRIPELQCILLRAKNLPKTIFEHYLKSASIPVTVTEDYYDGINACDAAIVASGTATLETALLEKPMVVVYKSSRLTAFIVRLLLKIPYVSLVNIVAGKKVVEELIQERATPELMAEQMVPLLTDGEKVLEMRQELKTVRAKLGTSGASERAANVVLEELSKNC